MQNYKAGYVFFHTLTNKIYTKFSITTLINKYTKRALNPYCRLRVTRDLEKFYTGSIIPQEKEGLSYTSKNKPKLFAEKLASLLLPLPKTVLRTDDEGKQKPHSTSCEFARDDTCNCWCAGKYHGIRP